MTNEGAPVTDRRVVDDAMRRYYDKRAAEYDDWWLGTGLHARRDRPGWHWEVNELIAVLAALPPARVLDVACGTGFLTQHLRGVLHEGRWFVVVSVRAAVGWPAPGTANA